MVYRAIERIHYWIDYLSGAALLVTGVELLRGGTLLGVALLFFSGALLLAALAQARSKRAQAVEPDERGPVPSIQDDGSLQ